MSSHPYARAEPDLATVRRAREADLATVRRIDDHFFAAVPSQGDEAG